MDQAYPVEAFHFDQQKRRLVFVKAYIIDSCNYNCSYCYNKKPRTNEYLDLNKLLFFLKDVHKKTNKNIFLELIGGEPTLHPGFLEFCQNASNLDFIDTIYIYSNFSGRLQMYMDLIENKNIHLNLSWHSLQHDNNKQFYLKAKSIKNILDSKQKQRISFNIMLEHGNLDYALIMHTLICKLGFISEIAYVGDLCKINSIHRYSYSEDEYDKISQCIKINIQPETTIKLSDGSMQNYCMNDLMHIIDSNKISFCGWLCNAGIDRLYIHCDSNVYRCQQEFENGNTPIYSLDDGFQMQQPHKCTCEACICEGFVFKKKR